jgi:osmoprotectant transport system permease protein
LAAGGGSAMIGDTITWLNDPAHWRGASGIANRLGEHFQYSAIAMVVAFIIAFPLGLVIGHTGKATWLVVAANSLRALPTLGILILFVIIISPIIHTSTDWNLILPTEIALAILAIPPILSNTFAGVQNVEPDVRDAAQGMGMTGLEVLRRVELPVALPLIFSGIRSAALQVIATATIASFVGLGGLGRLVYDGLSVRDFPQMVSGAVLVAALAVGVDVVIALIQRFSVSRGISGRFRRNNLGVPNQITAAVTETKVSI